VTSIAAWATVCGLALGVGLWSLASLVPHLGRPRLVTRIAPYLADVSPQAREMLSRGATDPLPVIGMLLAPFLLRGRAVLGRVLGGAATIELRLRQSGSPLGVEGFRSRQLLWGLGGTVVGLAAVFAISRSHAIAPVLGVIIVVIGGAAGVVLRDHLLQRAARARLHRIANELPTVLEFLTLSLSAGEGILDALRRVSQISQGALAGELARVVADVNTGIPLAESLRALDSGIRLPALSRCVEQITGALERGTPLSEVLRAQAQDGRDDAKRELLELAGKKEVAMLIPLVFLILPTTIAFAIFPGIFVLQLGF